MNAWILVLVLAQTRLLRQSAASDPDGESCDKKIISCIQCSTDGGDPGSSLCRDPFDSRVQKEFKKLYETSPVIKHAVTRRNITTVLCDGFCVKWVRASLDGETEGILRTCSTGLEMRFALTASVCIYESRTGRGQMCFCRESMCNSSVSTGVWLLSVPGQTMAATAAVALYNAILRCSLAA